MKYVATRTIGIVRHGKHERVFAGEVVSPTKAKKFGLGNFEKLVKVAQGSYTKAECELLAKLYLEHNGSYTNTVSAFMTQTGSMANRTGSVQCMVRRIAHVDNNSPEDKGLPPESHKDFAKVYASILAQAPSPSRFL